MRALITFLVLLTFSVAAAEQKSDLLAKKLAEYPGAERAEVVPIVEETVFRAFPEHQFSVVRFRQYPVAKAVPQGLTANNLFVVKPDGSVEYLDNVGALERFFKAGLAPVKTEAQAKDGVKAWLRLAQEYYQDGFFQFSIPDSSLRVALVRGRQQVTGTAFVNEHGGNSGKIVATLTFDPTGKLAKIAEKAQVNAGIRPICQATKLLDPDPIVRGMAEQAILVMGKEAKGYLDEQRAKAGPELQQAIDRIWRRILTEQR